MCIFKSKIEAAAFKGRIKSGHASPSKDKCAYLNQSDLHGNVVLELIYPILDVFQDEINYTNDFASLLTISPLISEGTQAKYTVREDVIGVFVKTDESHSKMKLIFESLFLYFLGMAISFQLKLSSPALGVNMKPNPATNVIVKVFTRNFNETIFH